MRIRGVNTPVPVALWCHVCARAPGVTSPAQPGAQAHPGCCCSQSTRTERVQGRRGRPSACALLPWCQGDAQRPHTHAGHMRVREREAHSRGKLCFNGEAGAGWPVLDAPVPRSPLGPTGSQVTRGEPRLWSEQDQGVTAGF